MFSRVSCDSVFENLESIRAPNADILVFVLPLAFCRRQKLESQISFCLRRVCTNTH
jgi:hypothetical protein